MYSIRNAGDRKDLTVETGAYRYNRKRMGIITDIIERLLKLPHRFYQVSRARRATASRQALGTQL